MCTPWCVVWVNKFWKHFLSQEKVYRKKGYKRRPKSNLTFLCWYHRSTRDKHSDRGYSILFKKIQGKGSLIFWKIPRWEVVVFLILFLFTNLGKFSRGGPVLYSTLYIHSWAKKAISFLYSSWSLKETGYFKNWKEIVKIYDLIHIAELHVFNCGSSS